MKYTSIKTITEEVELTTPCYTRFSEKYTKILNEKYCLVVENWSKNNFGISITELSCYNPFGNDGWVFITEDEFNYVYEEVLEKIKSFQLQLNEQPA